MGVFGTFAGDMNISSEKKKMFEQHMIKLLNLGGMMSFEVVKMYGHEMGLLKPVEIFPGGKVCFHYNYFEDDAWETACFDSERCELHSEKIGCGEFKDVMMAGYMLYEAYGQKGMTNLNGDTVNTTVYMGWINNILGTSFSMKNRFHIWENIEEEMFLNVERNYSVTLSKDALENIIPSELMYAAGGTDFADLMYIINGTSELMQEESKMIEKSYPADVLQCRKLLMKFFENSTENSVEVLWDFLKKEYHLRQKESDSKLKEIAEMSLFIPARVFVYLTAELIEEMEFWPKWKELKELVYHDECMKQYASEELLKWRKTEREKTIAPVSTSEFLCQDGCFTFWGTPEEIRDEPNYYISDDDRLYWWDGSKEVKISLDVEEWLVDLAKRHEKIMEEAGCMENVGDFNEFFLKTIAEIDEYYQRVFPFQTMFYEFLQNGTKKEYIAAVVLLKQLADSKEYRKAGEIIKYARRWDMTSKNVTHNIARIRLKRYLSVMANRKLRNRYFDF